MIPLMLFLHLFSKRKSLLPNELLRVYSLKNGNDTKNGLLLIFAISITGVALNNAVFYFGLNFTLASDSALITGLSPIISILLTNLFMKKPFLKNQIVGSLLGLIGVILIIGIAIFNLNVNRIIGDFIVLIAISLWSSSFIFSKKATALGYSPITVTFYSIAIAVVFMSPLMIFSQSFRIIITLLFTDMTFLFAILFFGLFAGALAYSLWYGTIEKLGPVETAIFLDSMPFWTLFYSFMILSENISVFHILGLIFISIGVVAVNERDLFTKNLNNQSSISEKISIN
jgi:drug/metabolite transporter (DMT)-like permease